MKVLLLAFSAAAFAGDAPTSVADAFRASWRAGDAERMAALAAADDPDPFLVADALLETQGADPAGDGLAAAAAWAERVAVRKPHAALPGLVERWRGWDAPRLRKESELRERLRARLEPGASPAPPDSIAAVRLLHARAEDDERKGRLEEAARGYREAAAAARALGWLARSARALRQAGLAAGRSERYAAALECHEEERKLHEELGARREAARGELFAAEMLSRLRETSRAIERFARALAELEAVGDREGVAQALQGLGWAHVRRGATEEALPYYDRARETWRALDRGIEEAKLLSELASLEAVRGETGKALALHERAHQELLARGERRPAARVLLSIAMTLQDLGRQEEALATLKKAEAECAALSDRTGRTLCLFAEGCLLKTMGRFGEALDLLEEAQARQEETGNQGAADVTRERIAEIWFRLGRPDPAAGLLEEVLRRQEQRGDRAAAMVTGFALATALDEIGDFERAGEAFARTLQQAREGGDRGGQARALAGIGRAQSNRGLREEAVRSLRLALREAESAGARSVATVVRMQLGLALAVLGRHDEAREALERARREAVERGDRYLVLQAGRYLARVDVAAGRFGEARDEARAGLRAVAALNREAGELDARALAPSLRELSDLGLRSLVAEGREEPAEALRFAETGRGFLLAITLLNRKALENARLPPKLVEAQARARATARARWKAVADLAARADVDAARLRSARKALDDAHRELEDVVSRIQREERRTARVLYPEPVGLEELRGALAPEAAYVHYQLAGDRAVALVVRRDGAALRDLGDADAIAREAQGYLHVVQARGREEEELARGLYDRLVRPLHGALEGATRLLVSPDGALSFLPFEALARAEEGRGVRLVEEREVVYVPSATIWAALREEAEPRSGEGLLALADPVYPGDTAVPRDVSIRGFDRLVRLPESAAEVEAVAGLFPSAERTVLLGERATIAGLERALRETRKRLSVLHVACHGLVDLERPYLSGLALSGGEVLALDAVYRLRIPADLVVLSACETGRGRLVRGEGVLGLVRAFLYAGSPRVVVSNWKVADDGARTLMAAFYDRMKAGGLPPAAALRAAKRQLLAAGEPPGRWAAFVLWGRED